jgi:hypothetical protein
MSATKTISKTAAKKVFTRITLDVNSLKAVSRVQSAIQNYDLNDAVKFIFGLGLGQLDTILPDVDDNGFTAVTKAKLLKAKQESEANGSKSSKNPK